MSRGILILLLLPVSASWAYEMPVALNNYAHELAICSAYFMATAEIVERQSPDISKKYKTAGETAFEMSVSLTSQKLALARVEMAMKSISSDINYDSSNFSILLNKYSDQCETTLLDPDARIKYWIDKKD